MSEMSKSAYARHRNCSPGYVTKLGNTGRLVITANGLVDADASDRLIEQTAGERDDVTERNAAKRAQRAQAQTTGANAAHAKGRAAKTPPRAIVQADSATVSEAERVGSSLQTSRAVKEKYAALKAKAEYEAMIGNLISKDDVDAAMRYVGGAVRAAFDVFPDQTAPLVAPVTDLAEIHEIITQSARDALHGIGEAIKRQLAELEKGKA